MDSSIVIQNELNISSCSYMPWGKEPSEKVTGRQSPGEFMHGGYRPEHVGLGKRQSLGSAPTQHSYYTYPRQGHQGYGHQLYVPYGPQALNGMAESDPQRNVHKGYGSQVYGHQGYGHQVYGPQGNVHQGYGPQGNAHQAYGPQGNVHQVYVPYGSQAPNGMAQRDRNPQCSTGYLPGYVAPNGMANGIVDTHPQYSTGYVDDMQHKLKVILEQQGLLKGKYVMIPPVVLPLSISDLPGVRQYDIIGQLLTQLEDVRKREGTPSLPSVINILIDLYRRIRMHENDCRILGIYGTHLTLGQILPMVNDYSDQLGLIACFGKGNHATVKNQLESILMKLEDYGFDTGVKALMISGIENTLKKTSPSRFRHTLHQVTKEQVNHIIDKFLICCDIENILYKAWNQKRNTAVHPHTASIPRYPIYEEFQNRQNRQNGRLRFGVTKNGYKCYHKDIIEKMFHMLEEMLQII